MKYDFILNYDFILIDAFILYIVLFSPRYHSNIYHICDILFIQWLILCQQNVCAEG